MKINKSFIKTLAALLILIYHLWIPMTSLKLEKFIVAIGYVGVDLFFFLSAYSLAGRKIEYKSFVKNRFISIYGKFALFTIISAIYKSWSISKTVRTLLLIEFFTRGGGSYLWFVPAIMIFYVTFPLFHNWENKYKGWIVLAVWFVTGVVITQFTNYNALFIFLNRIPVLLAGYYFAKIDKETKAPYWLTCLLLVVGVCCLYFFGYTAKLRQPIYDIFYVLTIPFVVSVCLLSNCIGKSKVIDIIGKATLEIYAMQMTFGFNFTNTIYSLTKNAILTDVIMLVAVIGSSIIVEELLAKPIKKLMGK